MPPFPPTLSQRAEKQFTSLLYKTFLGLYIKPLLLLDAISLTFSYVVGQFNVVSYRGSIIGRAKIIISSQSAQSGSKAHNSMLYC